MRIDRLVSTIDKANQYFNGMIKVPRSGSDNSCSHIGLVAVDSCDENQVAQTLSGTTVITFPSLHDELFSTFEHEILDLIARIKGKPRKANKDYIRIDRLVSTIDAATHHYLR